MSRIEALEVQGIRSFGPEAEDRALIKFGSPLTLILGENGCGKTTIIEALTYATCGELPNNTDRGKGFVHDPKLTSKVDTRASVKLRITDIKGNKLTVCRPMQTIQKQKNMVFQTLETLITVTDENGKSVSLNRKCIDANAEMCQAMGVSKAILQYVIFCHQEDSNWPLDEGKKLKERFDSIFDTAKFNKCLENIKKYRAELLAGLIRKRDRLSIFTEFKEEASNKKANLDHAEGRVKACRDRVATMKKNLRPVQDKLLILEEKEENFAKLFSEQETLKMRVKDLTIQINEYESLVEKVFDGTDEELQSEIKNFKANVQSKEAELDELVKAEEELGAKVRRFRDQISEEQTKLGQYMRDVEEHKISIDERNSLVCKLGEELKIGTSVSQLGQPDELEKALESLRKSVQDQKALCLQIQNDQKREEDSVQSQIDTLRVEKAQLEASVNYKKCDLEKTSRDLSKLSEAIAEADRSSEMVGVLQVKLERVKKELESMESSNKKGSLTAQLLSSEKEKEDLEDQIILLEKELSTLQLSASIHAELDVLRSNKNEKEKEVSALLKTNEESLIWLLKGLPQSDHELKPRLDQVLENVSEEVRKKKDEINSVEKALSKLKIEEDLMNDKITSLKKQLQSDSNIIKHACGDKDFDETLIDLNKSLQDLQDKKGVLSSSEYMFRRYVQKLREKSPNCPLCHRGFQASDDVSQLILELTDKARDVPSKLRENKEKLDLAQSQYQSLLQLKPKRDKLIAMEAEEIPEVETKLNCIKDQIEENEATLSLLKSELTEPERNEALAKKIYNDIVILDRYRSEAKKLKVDILRLESKLPSGIKKNLKEALQEQRDLRDKLQKLTRDIKGFQEQLNELSTKLHVLQDEKNGIQSKQLKMAGSAQRRAELSEKKTELENLSLLLHAQIDESQQKAHEVTRQLDQAQRELKILQTQNSKDLRASSEKCRLLESKLNEILKINSKIAAYDRSGSGKKCTQVQESLNNLKAKEDSLNYEIEDLGARKESIKEYLASQSLRERELEDNVKLRDKIKEKDKCTSELKAKREKLGNIDYSRIQEERKSLKLEEEKITCERSRAEGVLTELLSTIEDMRKELNLDKYKFADKNYRDQFVDIEVSERTCDDLNKYYKALDWAMIKYHQDKMRHINGIIRDLWQKIYNGNDIDWIEIKTNEEPSNAADLKRVFNYRVVQTKCGVELDMRGRCSAGQKVLASLIIRIALAEAFSANCGILALDEPTTNLDEKNTETLCETLREIIISHLHKKNFQLIIITHDKKFLDALTQIDEIAHYYEVVRNRRGKSEVLKKIIRQE